MAIIVAYEDVVNAMVDCLIENEMFFLVEFEEIFVVYLFKGEFLMIGLDMFVKVFFMEVMEDFIGMRLIVDLKEKIKVVVKYYNVDIIKDEFKFRNVEIFK